MLFRPVNLVIVAVTQFLLEFLILIPALEKGGVAPILDMPHFFLLVLSTVLIAAGGYVINDIEDVDIDRINKPERQVVSRKISVRTAWIYYIGLFFIGLLISLYLAVYIDNLPLLAIYPGAWLLLFLYSRYFKKMPLIGNVTVAFFCAFTAGIVWFAEREAYFNLQTKAPEIFRSLTEVFVIYMFFAFISTLYREIIKDLEDYRGDSENGCRTLPVVLGMQKAKTITAVTGMVFLTGILSLPFYFSENDRSSFGASIFIVLCMFLPLLYSLFLVWKSREKADYRKNSKLAKYLMAAGILLLFFL